MDIHFRKEKIQIPLCHDFNRKETPKSPILGTSSIFLENFRGKIKTKKW